MPGALPLCKFESQTCESRRIKCVTPPWSGSTHCRKMLKILCRYDQKMQEVQNLLKILVENRLEEMTGQQFFIMLTKWHSLMFCSFPSSCFTQPPSFFPPAPAAKLWKTSLAAGEAGHPPSQNYSPGIAGFQQKHASPLRPASCSPMFNLASATQW